MGKKLNICIITPEKNVYSETFIRTHIEHIPATVHHLYGNSFPTHYGNGQRLPLSHGFIGTIVRKLKQRFQGDFAWEELKKESLKEYLVRNKIDAVLAEYGPTGHAVKDICQVLDVPLIVHFHGYDAYEYATLKKFDYYRDLFPIASAIVVVSKDMKKQLLSLGAPEEKLVHIVYGIDMTKFYGCEPHLNPPIFLYVGRFVDKKAPHLTILAFKDVINYIPDARLMMFGNGHLLEACQQLVRSLNMSQSVEFLGAASSDQIASYMRKVRGFVLHSMKTSWGDTEGTPVAVLEAAASGLPIVSTFHAGIPDVVINGETGFLVKEGDITSMADGMIQLCQDPALAASMGKKAQDYVSKNFSREESIRQLYETIEDFVKKGEIEEKAGEPLGSRVVPVFEKV